MDFELGDKNYNQLQMMVKEIAFTKDLEQKIDATLVVIYSLDEELYDKVYAKEFKKYLLQLTNDKEFMRRLQQISVVKNNTETAMEYAGFDYLSHPEYHYDYEMEERIRKVSNQISIFLGKILKEIGETEKLEV